MLMCFKHQRLHQPICILKNAHKGNDFRKGFD